MKTAGAVLLVDDERGFRENVAERLQARGFRVLHAGEAESALQLVLSQPIDVALVDILMPGMDGITLLGRFKEIDPLMEVVIVTGQGSIESAVEAMRKGAYHYITKPVRLSELEMVARRAIEKTVLARQNRLYREELRRRRAAGSTPAIIAQSAAMKRIVEQAERIAQTDASVLIEGETGTGKEVIAELIHRQSPRRDHPLSVLNCGALSESLLDTELFGHEKGAFTGATEARPGIIEVANAGTLLLDEIGDIAPSAQVRLLRFLERGVFRRVGSTRERAVDVRVLAATHRDLAREVAEGRFRQDLYYRLLVFRLRIPPLRERGEDLLPLAEHFLSRLAGPGCPPNTLGAAGLAALRAYSWPGNVRELAHTIERACFTAQLAATEEIGPEHLGLPTSAAGSLGDLISLQEAEQQHIQAVLERLHGHRQKAAEILGITERHLYRLLQQFNAPGAQGSSR